MGDGMLALTWNNHSTTFFKTLSTVRLRERYTDVTLSCEGRFYQLHKLVLSTCSEYFEKIFEQTPCKHPVIVLRDVSCDELEALLNYMYLGSVSVAQNDLSRLIKVAELFQIKGLAVPDEPPKAVENNSLSKRNDTRDRSNSYRNSQPESSRTRTCASDSSDTPVPKRARTSENYMGSEHASQTSSSVLHSNELPKLEDRSRSQGSIGDSAAHEGPDIRASPGIQTPPFEFKIKEEVREEDSDSEDPGSSCAYDAMNESDIGGSYEPRREESQSNLIILPKTEPEDIPPDESSVTQPGLDQETYSENVLGVPGPSDAQGWYSEGDASGGLPGDKGSIGDESQDMHSLFASQQQPQQQQQQSQQQMAGSVNPQKSSQTYYCPSCSFTTTSEMKLRCHVLMHPGAKPFICPCCPASFTQKGNLNVHMRRHTGERPFACTKCPYRAFRKATLQRHLLSHSSSGSNQNI
ncbi:zinc finger and SCAN domain-containing protein 10-like isoform X17 [Macrobrachium nipponense]|uniref:zinc finger and SCAN domain-containing protein 10-like isoform X17 n=1 Tax=Macrobrachium nipponense TaxID=159736 RepID=UPI0030C800AD